MTEALGAVRALTIITRATRDRAELLESRLEAPVEALVLDDRGPAGPAPLLGAELERFAAGFDQDELALAVLPRLLLRARRHHEGLLVYVSAWAQAKTSRPPSVDGSGVRVDPWPLEPGVDAGDLHALVLPDRDWIDQLLERWSALAAGVLGEDRTLTARTTLRWLRALAPALGGVELAAASIAVRGGAPSAGSRDYGFAELPCGLPLTLPLRRLLRGAQREGRFTKPFSELDPIALRSWLAEPAAGSVPRYVAELRRHRGDLGLSFPEDEDGDAGLTLWARRHGRGEDPVLDQILPASVSPEAEPEPAPAHESAWPWGVNVVGYWRAELGIADAARLLVAGLDAVNVPLMPVSAPGARPPSRHRAAFVTADQDARPFGLNLLCVNPDGVLALCQEVGPALSADRTTIAYWWWELLDCFPAAWLPAFDLVEEVWVGSRHVQAAIEPFSPVPVRLVPIPVLPLPAAGARSALELPAGFLFVTMFDYNSAFERKNPLGVVEAFRRAFPPNSGAALLVKSINSANQPDNRDELAILAAGHPDIHLRDGYLTAPGVDELLAAADCVVSLHRAEGFGIPLARALRSGIPVIGTSYGGNLDFMTAENSYLVDHRPATVPGGTIYPPGAAWADPDLEQAAAHMRAVFEHPGEARARARRGAQALASSHSLERTGKRMAVELRAAHGQLARRPGRVGPPPVLGAEALNDLRRLIGSRPEGGRKLGGLRAWIVRALTAPLAEHARAVDERSLEIIARLADAARGNQLVLRELQDAVSRIQVEKANAAAIATLLAQLRAGRALSGSPGPDGGPGPDGPWRS